MIKKIRYIYQFLYYSSLNKRNFISFFPLISIILGTIIIFFTIGIMDGMEEAIFEKMESFNFTYRGKLTKEPLLNNNFDTYLGSIKKYLIFKGDRPKVVSITSIDNFDRFKNQHINKYLIDVSDIPGILIGTGLAKELDLEVGDKISISSPLDISLVNGIVPLDTTINVSGIFNYGIMDYDYNYAFVSNSELSKVIPLKINKIFLKSLNTEILDNKLLKEYNFISFKDSNREFLKAINTEKLLYSVFGYIVIFIASASSISLMSLFIVRKRKQIVILKTLGFKNIFITNILIVNSLLISLIGVLLGSLSYILIISINAKSQFIQGIFFNNLAFDFSINFNFKYIVQAVIISSFFMFFGSIYPILKILKINLANALNEKI